MKYTPRKVYIKESGSNIELSYKNFCHRRKADQSYMDKLFIPIQGCLVEVVREQYVDFYRDKERWRYLKKLDVNHGLLSLEGFTDSEGNVPDFIVDERTIEEIRIYDRADFNSNRRFYRWTNDVAEYLEKMAGRERQTEVKTVEDLLNEIENENLYFALVTVDRRTLQIILLKMQGYTTKEIAPIVQLTTRAIYARLEHLRKKLRKIL